MKYARIKNFLGALASDKAWQELYQARRSTAPDQGNRTIANVLLLGAVLLILATFISNTLIVQRDDASYLKSRNRVAVIDDSSLIWRQSQIRTTDCGAPNECWFAFNQADKFSTAAQWSTLSRQSNPYGNEAHVMLTTSMSPSAWSKISGFRTFVLVLPTMRYLRADVFVNGNRERSFLLSRQIAVPLEEARLHGQDVKVDVILRLYPSQAALGSSSIPAFISTVSEYDKYLDYRALKMAGRGDWIAVVARITLAMFAVLLFLLIDASPESLGLALFMGFDAINLSSRYGWLPVPWLGGWADIAIYNFCFMMGLLCRGYFYTQLARVGSKSVAPWLFLGGLVSAAYAGVTVYAANKPHLFWEVSIVRAVMFAVSLFGIVVCMRAIWSIRKSGLWWRISALACAVIGSIAPMLSGLDWLWPGRLFSGSGHDILNVLQFNAPYLLSLSAFINISSLENRVRSLTAVQVRARKIEEELEVARSVQKTLLRLPKLPDVVDFSFHHEAASFVSGDAFYAHWDEVNKVFTFLLNDVTGHGMQAALKASICNVMADVLWSKGMDRRDPKSQRSKLAGYHRLIREYLREQTGKEDVHSILGAEFHASTGKLNIYRVNAPMPILIRNGVGGGASMAAEMPSIKSGAVVSYDLSPGSVVVFASDGLFASSRDSAKLLRGVNEYLSANREQLSLSSKQIETAVLDIYQRSLSATSDDRTILVFRWRDLAKESLAALERVG